MKQTKVAAYSTGISLLIGSLFFCLPTHFFYTWAESQAYVRGLLVDYLLPKLYLSDLVCIAIVGIGLYTWHKQRIAFKVSLWELLFVGLTSLLVLIQFSSPYPWASVTAGLRLVLLCATGWMLLQLKQCISTTWIVSALLVTITFQSLVGISQFITQHSLAGYWFLGEPTLTAASGLASGVFGGEIRVLPYGTTAHPNVLAGILAVYLFLSLRYRKQVLNSSIWAKIAFWIIITLGGTALYLTQSVSGWIALSIGLLMLVRPQWLTTKTISFLVILTFLSPLLIYLVSPEINIPSITRRAHLNQNAVALWLMHPMKGSGLLTNAALGEPLSAVQEPTRFVQPAHHVPLLWISETGLVGILWVLAVLKLLQTYPQRSFTWLILLPIAALDHYLLTSMAGNVLVLIAVLPLEATTIDLGKG